MTTVLTGSELTPFLSEYLSGGYQQERINLVRVVLEEGRVEADVEVTGGFVSSASGDYHFTVFSAVNAISQMAIIYGCWDNRLLKKEGEHYMRNIDITFRREIKTAAVTCQLTLKAKRDIRDLVYYSGYLSIDRGAFTGSASFVMPRPAGAGSRAVSE